VEVSSDMDMDRNSVRKSGRDEMERTLSPPQSRIAILAIRFRARPSFPQKTASTRRKTISKKGAPRGAF
jgi:hypothetical protein